MSSTNSAPLPLEGIRVVELCHLIAGPYCCQMLADEGAQVIKIEPPGGELTRHRDPIRQVTGEQISAYYASLNCNKHSIVLDLKNASGLGVLHELLETADVLVTNLRTSALERLGVHPKALHERYPRLVIACISGFGMEDAGDYADRAGLAMVAEAMAGATGLTRDHAGQPVWCGFALGDIAAGMTAHAAILLALRNQQRYGMGKLIDLGLVECMLPMVSVALGRVQAGNTAHTAFAGSNGFHGVPYGAFPASDGYVNIGVNHDSFWRRFCTAIDHPELGSDERYATYLERVKRQAEVHEITEAFTRTHTRAEIVARLVEVDVPVASILSMDEVVSDAYLHARGALRQVEDGLGGTFTLPACPGGFGTLAHPPRVPRLAEHRNEILATGLGLTPEDIAELERSGAFGQPAATSFQGKAVDSREPALPR
ncbi:CaiB/BaiF CoA transferase family protein [Paraburkholderia sp. HD33-4]|uniref:CaiB/BaiF CoA transferase family protein n=1 Tax=Paraburkholderia sp. HD33-4 TaxID=2883242 RepID=UPI001F39F6CB|nr:CaiB/BaiF CoA-transferase family protein [Paraburkholderia sp. HD33-4]